MPGGFFITFEGLDGSGKTTQINRLRAALQLRGLTVTQCRQPGGTPLGDQIRALLLDSRSVPGKAAAAPLAELALMFADRAQAITEIIAPALERGHIVLCDRFTDSSEAYQGGGRELGSDTVLALHRAICGDLQPDLTLLLLPPLGRSLERARRRNERHIARLGNDENRFEREADDFHERVYESYKRIATRDAIRVVTIASDATLDEVEAEVLKTVLSRIGERVKVSV